MSEKTFDRKSDHQAEEALLQELFSEAHARAPEPGPDFLARVVADAQRVQAGFNDLSGAGSDGETRGPSGFLDGLRGLVGGWATFGGLVTAALAGLWIGFVGAEQMGGMSAVFGTTSDSLGTVNLMPGGESLAFVDDGGF